MPHTALVLEPGNEFLEHRRRHLRLRPHLGAFSIPRLATYVTAIGPER